MSFIRASSSPMRLALSTGRIQTTPRLVRFASNHPTGPAHLPFDPSKSNFKYKFLAFVTAGISLPFVAVSYQLSKSAGSSA